MSAEIQTIEVKPLATFQSTMDDLIVFVNDYSNLVVTDETLEESKKARMALRDKRFDIQRIEKLKAAMLAEQRRIQKEQEEREAKIRAEQAAIDKQKRDIEESKIREANEKARLAELEQARKEAAEKAIKDAEIKAIKEAEQKRETERLAKVEAERKEALRPDKQKLIDFAKGLNGIAFPVLKDRSAQTILLNALNSIENVSKSIIAETEKL